MEKMVYKNQEEAMEKWGDFHAIKLNGLMGTIRKWEDKVLLSVGSLPWYRGLYGFREPSPADDPNPFYDVYFKLIDLVEEGILKEPEQGDDAGTQGRYFWFTTGQITVKGLVEKLREKGFEIQQEGPPVIP